MDKGGRHILLRADDREQIVVRQASQDCVRSSMIPNIVHFIRLRGRLERPWSLINTCCVRAAHAVQKPDKIILWTDQAAPEPIRDLVEVRHYDPPPFIGAQHLEYAQYRADLARLHILKEHGGIYLDTDMLLIKPLRFDKSDFVAGIESDEAICGAALMARPGAPFIDHWLAAFERGVATGVWAYQCVNTPYEIAIRRPDLIRLLPRETFAAFDFSRNHLFDEAPPQIPDACHGLHVWETFWRDHLGHVDERFIERSNSLFATTVRQS